MNSQAPEKTVDEQKALGLAGFCCAAMTDQGHAGNKKPGAIAWAR
ncbi:hypothetical protein [Polaromonas sp. OV174]|nr:hypothetical protein [Polaromonas sp. OV174]